MRLHRFYTTTNLNKNIIVTDPNFIHQWKNVFRYKVGDSVILFGTGYECEYKILNIDKKSVELEKVSEIASLIRPKNFTLALSLIKKDNLELVLQKCTELGVSDFILMQTDRSEKKGFNKERLDKILIEASEQSGWGSVPTLGGVMKLNDVMAEYPNAVILDGDSKDNFSKIELTENIIICIGPEGGFTESELASAAASGCRTTTLGPNTLRAETAAIAISSLVLL